MTVHQVVAYNFRRAREEAGWTQSQTGEYLEPFLGARLNQAGISAIEKTFDSDRRRNIDVSELVATFSVRDLHAAGVSAADLLHAGTSLSSLQDAGFSYQDLVGAGASPNELATLFPHEASSHDGPVSGGGY